MQYFGFGRGDTPSDDLQYAGVLWYWGLKDDAWALAIELCKDLETQDVTPQESTHTSHP